MGGDDDIICHPTIQPQRADLSIRPNPSYPYLQLQHQGVARLEGRVEPDDGAAPAPAPAAADVCVGCGVVCLVLGNRRIQMKHCVLINSM